MSLTDDSDTMDKNIRAKLNTHLKKRIKQTNSLKRKSEPTAHEPDTLDVPAKKPSGKGKSKKSKNPPVDDDDSDKGEEITVPEETATPAKVSTLDVLQLLLNEKKRSLMRDAEVINFIRNKQARIP